MTSAPNRRAVIGAVLAAGAVGAVPLAAKASIRELMEADRQAIERWAAYRALSANAETLADLIEKTEERLPQWAKIGPKWLCGPGANEEKELSEEPAITVTRAVEPGTRPNIRPSPEDIRAARRTRDEQIYMKPGGSEAYMHRICSEIVQAGLAGGRLNGELMISSKSFEFYRNIAERPVDSGMRSALAAFDESDRLCNAELVAYKSRKAAQAAERERIGLIALEVEHERTLNDHCEIMDEMLGADLRSPNALAAALMVRINENQGGDNIELASLRAIRPQLVGAIAENADRVLAEEEA